jgi:hypothetical protein
MYSTPVTKPTSVSSVSDMCLSDICLSDICLSDICLSDICLSVYIYSLDIEVEGSDRRTLSMFRGRSVRRHDFSRLYLFLE